MSQIQIDSNRIMRQDYFKDQKSLLTNFIFRETSVKVIFEILLNLGHFYKNQTQQAEKFGEICPKFF